MKCGQCSAPVADGQRFCGNCGARQDAAPRHPAPTPQDLKPAEAAPQRLWGDVFNRGGVVGGFSVELVEGSDGFFKKAPRQDLTARSIDESLALLRGLESLESSLMITLQPRLGDEVSFTVVTDVDRLFCLSFSLNDQSSFINSVGEAEILGLFERVRVKGPRSAYLELPRPPWEEG